MNLYLLVTDVSQPSGLARKSLLPVSLRVLLAHFSKFLLLFIC